MLEDISAHVLDISENSIRAGADRVVVTLEENVKDNILLFSVSDNGKGMTKEFIAKVTDPFTTTRTTRRVGMGLPFLKQSTELCGGYLRIDSEVGKGTETTAVFAYDSLDRPPVGDMAATVMTLIMGSPEIHWTYRHKTDNGEFALDTDEILEAIDGDRELLRSVEVGLWIKGYVSDGISGIKSNV